MRFFLDNCISPKYARALRVLAEMQQYEIVHLQDRFPPDIRDEDWIRQLGEEGDWVIVSGDPRISRSKPVRNVWRESGITAFFFADGWAQHRFWRQAADMVHWWPTIVLEAGRALRGSGFLIPVKGSKLKTIYLP
jgi:hypothetical protein